jgi:CheY-like chemotaxis protein
MATEQEIKSLNGPAVVAEKNRLDEMKILLVEDNEHNQILAETYLLKHRASVDIAANGRIALDMLKKQVYDVILMDIQMPIMDGITTTLALRNEFKIDTPIIACSAHAMASERLKCREAGMNDYISKPYTEDGLIGALSKYKKTPAQKAKLAEDNFGEVLRALESNISKTYADKIVGIFKERLPGEIALLEQSVEERDFKLMEERSHYQAGSMSSLHFKHGYQLAYAAERAASQGITDKANEATTQLINYLKELLTYLNEPVN